MEVPHAGSTAHRCNRRSDIQIRTRRMLLTVCLVSLAAAPALAADSRATAEAPAEAPAEAAAEAAALTVMEDFLAAFNARDVAAWADTLHFPHVRIASQRVAVYPDREAFIGDRDLEAFAVQTGWDHSTWDAMRVVQASAEKVHIAVTFTRFDAEGVAMASYDSLYVVERLDGRWGIRARSSFAP